jgi:hypothetical protein
MSFFAWLFGKRAEPATTIRPQERPAPPAASAGTRKKALADEAENLRRWRDSGQARAWVEARGGHWDHDDWLTLLEDLKRSPYWPMQADAVGLVLEEAKREWLQRN